MHTSKSTLKSRFFPKLFSIPLICWTIFFLVVMLIPDDPGEEPLTWLDFFEATLFFTVIWFIIPLSSIKSESRFQTRLCQPPRRI